MEQRWRASGHAGKRGAENSALAGRDVGHFPIWQQRTGYSGFPDSGKNTARERGRRSRRRRGSRHSGSGHSEGGVMNKGGLLALFLAVATVVLIVIGCVWPVEAAKPFITQKILLTSSSTPEEAVRNLGQEIQARDWQKAYDSFANKAQFTEQEFELDLTGYTTNLRTYSTLDRFNVWPLHAS